MNVPSACVPASIDDADFSVPWPGLFADIEAGSAHVALVDDFFEAAPYARFKILQQWVAALTAYRDRALIEMFQEFVFDRRDATIVEQIEAFRQECGRRGMTCPPDLAVLLQRY